MKILLGITGASGSIYGIRFLQYLKELGHEIMLTVTSPGHKVCKFETGIDLINFAKEQHIPYYDIEDIFAPPASGSYRLDAVVILPCSMGTLGRISGGMSSNLLERAADVALKERFKLIVSPRETPLNSIHLENMLKLSQAGGILVPASVAFYTKPNSLDEIIDFHVGKIVDILGLDQKLFPRWRST